MIHGRCEESSMNVKQNLFVAAVFVSILAVGNLAAEVAANKAELTFVPWPESVKQTGGELSVTAAGRIVASDKALAPLAQVVSDELFLLTGVRLAPAAGSAKAGDIALAIDFKALGLAAARATLTAMPMEKLQTNAVYKVTDTITIPVGKGLLLTVEE
jgi:hypothetical protein